MKIDEVLEDVAELVEPKPPITVRTTDGEIVTDRPRLHSSAASALWFAPINSGVQGGHQIVIHEHLSKSLWGQRNMMLPRDSLVLMPRIHDQRR